MKIKLTTHINCRIETRTRWYLIDCNPEFANPTARTETELRYVPSGIRFRVMDPKTLTVKRSHRLSRVFRTLEAHTEAVDHGFELLPEGRAALRLLRRLKLVERAA